MQWLIEVLNSWRRSLRRVQATKLIFLPSITGALTGAACIAFVEMVNLVQWLAIGSAGVPLKILPSLSWYHVLLVPVVGGLVLGPMVRLLAPEAAGHGVPEVIEAVMIGGGRIRKRIAVVKSMVSAVTIGTGGSVGREGPIVQIGAAVGSALGQLLHLPSEQLKTLAACGAGGGIAAVFNAPIAGAFFALEVITGNFAMPSFSPVILSSVMATVVSRAYFGDHPAFIVQPYKMESVWEIGVYAGLGIACGVVSAVYVWMMDRFETWVPRLPIPRMWQAGVGGLALGALLLVVPNVYGVGYATMDAALSGSLPWTMLAVLVPVKMLATSVTLSSGGSGGVFLPSLYIGSVAGGLYGTVCHALFPHLTAGSGAYALVGMAGVLAAATHSPITAMILLFEVTGDYKIILPVMIVSTLSTVVCRAVMTDSLYTLKLSRQGIALNRREDLIMRSHTAGEVMHPAEWVVEDRTVIGDTVQYFLEHDVMQAYVTAADGRFIGTISIHGIKDPELRELGPLVVAGDIAETNVQAVAPEDTLAECMERFLLSEGDELPVVDADGHLLGVVSRRDVLRVYSSELLRHEYMGVASQGAAEAQRYAHLTRGFTLARVPAPKWLAGRSLRGANMRAAYNLTVVAIRRGIGGEDLFPDPEQPLQPDDVLVVVGKPADIDRFRRATGAAVAIEPRPAAAVPQS